ncbi:MAG: hypothetical protein CVU88_00395 [Firmicutes bacterium HGW-Firmicutes-13]|nr:MAG: hypothetical protein CVU88_00395 [Firmicutes bacterium HGW-Firmicutes-13]
MFGSIRSKLTITYIIIILLASLLTNSFLLNILEQYYLGYQKEVLSRSGRLVADFAEGYLRDGDSYAVLSNLAEDFSRQIGSRVIIVNPNKVVIGDSVRVEGLIGSLLTREEIDSAWAEGEGYSIQKSPKTKQWVMQVSVPIVRGDTLLGAVFLSYSLAPLYDILADIKNILLFIMVMSLIFASFLGAIFAQKITKPISVLTVATKQIARGNMEQNIKIIGDDEIGELTTQFNGMTAKLREMTCQLENTIREVSTERNKLTAILTNMIDGVIAVDAEGKLIMANPVAEKMFNFNARENMGQSLKEITSYKKLDYYFLKVWKERKEVFGELQFEDHLFKLTVSPLLSETREILGSVAVLQNITADRKLERKQREFVADVSHELRTPLSSLNILVKTMLDYDLAVDEGRDFLKDMDAEIERLSVLVQDILDLTRLESLKGKLNLRKTDVKKLFEEILVRMLSRAERNQQELTWDLPDLPLMEVDEDQIKRVLINLVDNAIKYTPEGGWLKVEAKDLGEEVIFKVRDTGSGIPEEDQPRIFERFYRVDKTRSREMGGTGLGLAICSEIITAHGGKIWGESKLDYGSTLVFTLPKNNDLEGKEPKPQS